MITLKARTGSRMSSHCELWFDPINRKPMGNMVGKPTELRPLAENGKKSVKLDKSCRLAQPPLLCEMSPLGKSI